MDLNLLKDILEKLEAAILEENRQRVEDGGLSIGTVKIQVMGQVGLMTHPAFPSHRITLIGTADLDATVRGEWFVKKQLETLIKPHDLDLDDLSDEISVPDESSFTEVFNGRYVRCEILDPIYLLTSKAIKAKEKNRLLIRDALDEFGKPLEDLITKYKGDLNYFRNS